MNKFKTFLLSVAAFAALTLTTQAQYTQGVRYSGPVATSLNGGTNNLAGATTNSAYAVNIDCPLTSMVAIQPSFKLISTGTSAVVFKFDRSIDKSIWETAAITVSVTASGTNVVTAVGTSTGVGAGYLRLSTIENPNANAITNLVLKYAVKNGL